RHQIEDGVNGFLVSSVDEAATRLVQLLKDEGLRKRLGDRARETVRERFLLTRYLEQYLDLFNSFETSFRLHSVPARARRPGHPPSGARATRSRSSRSISASSTPCVSTRRRRGSPPSRGRCSRTTSSSAATRSSSSPHSRERRDCRAILEAPTTPSPK